jgi:N-acetylmuramoyl-L-alanine amidase
MAYGFRLPPGRVRPGVGLLLVAALMIFGIARSGAASGRDISGFRVDRGTEGTSAVLQVPAGLDYRVFTLSHPARVVLDLLNAGIAQGLELSTGGDPLIKDIRSAPRFDGKGARIVFDLAQDTAVRSFLRHDGASQELVVELGGARTQTPTPVMTAAQAQPERLRDVVVAIDPGHGGHDTGAIGPDGLEEKTVTLAIAKALYGRLSKVQGIKPVLTRDGDYFVTLTERRKIAHEAHADLFISIHADSSPYHYPKGSTVYILSEHGASSVAARILAASENSADEVAGVNLAAEQPVVRSTILNLSQRGTIAQSSLLARQVMGRINSILPLHSDEVERAAFVVLKSPDIPSILVETAFISNRTEEHELASTSFRDRIAGAIATGVEKYAERFAPPGTLIAARRTALYTMQQG